jgi:hypothetical protein
MKRRVFLFLPLMLMCSLWATGQSVTSDQMEKVHSRLFRKGPVGQIPEMLAKTTGDVHVRCVLGISQRIAVVPPPSPAEELGTLAANSDLVMLGKAGISTAHMTADKDFLYTDWNFTVEEVLKNDATPVQPGAAILVTRPGGKLQVNGRMVYADCGDFLDFTTGRQYLLYLRFVPETHAYIGGGWGAFEVSAATRRLDPFNYPKWKISDKDTLLKTAREGVAISHTIPRSGGSQ